jgi:hypothetical protein
MRIPAKMTAEQFRETRRLVWAKYYWLTLFNNFVFHQVGLLPIMLTVGIGAVVVSWVSVSHGWSTRLIGWPAFCLAATVFFVAMLRSQLPSARKLLKLNKDLPTWIELAEDGVSVQMDDDLLLRVPWKKFKGWKNGSTVKVLVGDASNYFILPTVDLDEQTQDKLVARISEHLHLI